MRTFVINLYCINEAYGLSKISIFKLVVFGVHMTTKLTLANKLYIDFHSFAGVYDDFRYTTDNKYIGMPRNVKFQYTQNIHSAFRSMTESSFDSCGNGNAVGNAFSSNWNVQYVSHQRIFMHQIIWRCA